MPDKPTNDELSAEIARRLFGWREVPDMSEPDLLWWVTGEGNETFAPIYASDHNAAMGLVVPEMRKRGWRFSMWDSGIITMAIAFGKGGAPHIRDVPFGEEPRGICEAAEAALDSEEAK